MPYYQLHFTALHRLHYTATGYWFMATVLMEPVKTNIQLLSYFHSVTTDTQMNVGPNEMKLFKFKCIIACIIKLYKSSVHGRLVLEHWHISVQRFSPAWLVIYNHVTKEMIYHWLSRFHPTPKDLEEKGCFAKVVPIYMPYLVVLVLHSEIKL